MAKSKLKAVIVKPDMFPETQEFSTFNAMLRAVGITGKTPWETYLLEESNGGIDGVGVCVRDQDTCKGKQNLMGIKGAFAIVGMERTLDEQGNTKMTTFTSLTDEQIKEIERKLIRQSVFSGYAYGIR